MNSVETAGEETDILNQAMKKDFCVLTLGVIMLLFTILQIYYFNVKRATFCPRWDRYTSILSSSTQTFVDIGREESIVFLKTHKTGSSTLTSILWRELCEVQNRNCFLPPFESPGKTWDFNKINDRIYLLNSNGTAGRQAPFDVWLHHAKAHSFLFNNVVSNAVSILDKPRSLLFMSIVRRPSLRFRSAWTWYQHASAFIINGIKTNRVLKYMCFKEFSLERFVELMMAYHSTACRLPMFLKEMHYSKEDIIKLPFNSICSQNLSSKGDIDIWTKIYGLYIKLTSILWTRYARYISINYFKYRTGLDATSEELVGLRTSDPAFADGFEQLLLDVMSGKVLLLVCDRFDESLLVMRRRILATGKNNGLPHHYKNYLSHQLKNNSDVIQHPINSIDNNDNKSISYHSSCHNFSVMKDLLYLKQKKQTILEYISSEDMQNLDQLQPYDALLYKAANIMLDRYLLKSDIFDLKILQHQLRQLEMMCVNVTEYFESASITDCTKLCDMLERDNRDLVQQMWLKRSPSS